MFFKRSSGILLHLTSLPSRFGIGDLGPTARGFVDFLASAGQSAWQFLPVCPTNPVFGNSPYMSMAAFAGNPLLISPDLLLSDNLLDAGDLPAAQGFSEYLVNFEAVIRHKTALLAGAHQRFLKSASTALREEFSGFCAEEDFWLADYALFMALREVMDETAWHDWPRPLATRQPEALAAARGQHERRIGYYRFEQFCFFRQWRGLRDHARKKGIQLIGDIPIYVGLDSADVWANQELFELDTETLLPTVVAGVPPDYFSETGQRWGNPLYRWQDEKGLANQKLFGWWRDRFRHIFALMDVVRVDHFRGFEAYWEVKAEEETAMNGRWRPGPGRALFDFLKKSMGELPVIAEDLGLITPEVEELRDALGLPGMKILQFAFDSDPTNPYLPHNFTTPNCVVFTGTHDNDTTLGWFLGDKVTDSTRNRLRRYANSRSDADIPRDMVRLALASSAALAILPLQDVLGFGGDCRMNKPSTSEGNWRWRVAPRFLTGDLQLRLRDECAFYNRLPQNKKEEAASQPTGRKRP